MRQERDSNTDLGSLASRMFSLLLRQPLVEVWSIVDVENVVIASGQDGELRMAAGPFDGVNQFLHFFHGRELIVRPVKQPERNRGQFRSPGSDRTDGSQRNDRGETFRHFVSGIERPPSPHAVSSNVDAVRIDAASPRHFVEDRAERFHIRPDFPIMALRRDNDERETLIGFDLFREPELLHLANVIAPQ